MSDYLVRGTRGNRYAREERVRKSEILARRDKFEGDKGLLQQKKEVTKAMNEEVKKTIEDLLRHTHPDYAEKICKKLEKNVYRKYPTPANCLRMAVDYISASGIDVTVPLWAIQLGQLKIRVNQATNPNKFYAQGGY